MPISIIIILICGIISAVIASSKGRSPVGWFFIGLLIGLIGVIIIVCLPNVREEQARNFYMEQENRRLREQIRQEQIKAEAFRSHTQRRLDMHDQSLGLDTRQGDHLLHGAVPVAGLLQAGEPLPPPLVVPVPVPRPVEPPTYVQPPAGADGWYYSIEGRTWGPVASAAIQEMVRGNTIPRNTLVWIQGMPDWTTVDLVPEFNAFVNS